MSKKTAYPPGFEVFDELPPPDPEHLALVVAVPLRVVVLACGCQLVDAGGRVLVPAWVGATAEETAGRVRAVWHSHGPWSVTFKS